MAKGLSFCMITTFYPPHHFGGDAMYAYWLANALGRRGHRVTVVHNSDAYRALRGAEGGASFPHEPGVTPYSLRTPLPRLSTTVSYVAGRPALYRRALDDVFRRERFDVTHFHNVSLAGGPGVLSYGQGVRLYTVHEHWLVCPMHVLWRYNREPCDRPDCLRCTLAFRRPPQLWRYSNVLARQLEHVDLFLSPSRFAMRSHRERGFEGPMRHLPYFIPASHERATSSHVPTDRPYFLYVGRLERIKAADSLLEVFRGYRKADLLLAGRGTEEAALRARAADLDHVRFLGYVPPASLGPLYSAAIAVIVPSAGYEVFPLVTLEALRHGVPAIVRDLGGLSEAIEDSGGGFVYRSPDDLVAAMERLRQDEALRADLGHRGRQGWERLWSEEPHVDRYLEIVDELRGNERGKLA
jgi:glycosyltransferase involved in cell wall biosynthesis